MPTFIRISKASRIASSLLIVLFVGCTVQPSDQSLSPSDSGGASGDSSGATMSVEDSVAATLEAIRAEEQAEADIELTVAAAIEQTTVAEPTAKPAPTPSPIPPPTELPATATAIPPEPTPAPTVTASPPTPTLQPQPASNVTFPTVITLIDSNSTQVTITALSETSDAWEFGTELDGFVAESESPNAPWFGVPVHFLGTDVGGSTEQLGENNLVYRYKLEFQRPTRLSTVEISGAAFNGSGVLRVLDENMKPLGTAETSGGNFKNTFVLELPNTESAEGTIFFIDEFETSSHWRFRSSISIEVAPLPTPPPGPTPVPTASPVPTATPVSPPNTSLILFLGNVTVGGQPIGDGLKIVAKIGDVFESSPVTTNGGSYAGLTVGPSSAGQGGTINFVLENSVIATQDFTFTPGVLPISVHLDLDFPQLP